MTLAQHYYISALITSIAVLVLLLFVRLKAVDKLLARRFCVYALCIAHWSFFVFLCTSVNNHDLSYLLCQICHMGGVFIPITFFHFVVTYTVSGLALTRLMLYVGYSVTVGISVSILLIPKLFIPDVVPKLTFNYFPNPGPLFIVWNILFVFFVLLCFAVLFYESLKRRGDDRKAISFFLFGNILGYTGGIGCFFPVYDISIFPFPFGIWGVFFFTCVTTIAVMRYKLIDIEFIIRRATVFAGLFAFVYATFTIFTIFGERLFSNLFGFNIWVSMIPTFIVIVIALRPLENFLTNATDKYLFQKKYDYRELLKTFTSEVLTVLDLQRLLDKTIEGLNSIIKLESCGILLLNTSGDKYELRASKGIGEHNASFSPENALIYCLNASHEPIIKDAERFKNSEQLKEDVGILNAELALPIVFRERMIGVVTLGMKKSGEPYNQDDIDILTSLARTEAIAISNAQLFDELSRTQAEAAQREKMAVIGTLAAGINHEICNPLGIARGQCEMFLLNYRDGIYKNIPEKELVAKCTDIFNKVINEVDRATGITKRLSSFAKPSSKFVMSDISVSDEIQEVLSILSHELRMGNIQVETKMPSSLPRIVADKKQIQEIFFNIIRNAAQAISGKGSINIRGYEQNDRIVIEIEDSGSGIPPDRIRDIFNPFFTTKEPGKGTGLGLFIVKQVVERNKGTISVQSEVGKGTKFTLSFETAKEMAAA